ncbi:hypothetical protein [uncultured Bilophila sp.]|uniref:hypothetical protein n=1 Tax=uncultured Bilophila sp. TaxID=529385 RepID=UPI00267012DF|nr:hypothetical protein [uncultured Bilophila sp.]
MAVLSPQHGENNGFLSSFSASGLHAWGILSVIPLEFQEIRHQPFPMAQPSETGIMMLLPILRS